MFSSRTHEIGEEGQGGRGNKSEEGQGGRGCEDEEGGKEKAGQ